MPAWRANSGMESTAFSDGTSKLRVCAHADVPAINPISATPPRNAAFLPHNDIVSPLYRPHAHAAPSERETTNRHHFPTEPSQKSTRQQNFFVADFGVQIERGCDGLGKADRIRGNEKARDFLVCDLRIVDANADVAVTRKFRRCRGQGFAVKRNPTNAPGELACHFSGLDGAR